MSAQVILEIIPEVSGTEQVESEIQGVGKAAQDAFKKANEENAKYESYMQRIEKAVIATGKANKNSNQEIQKTIAAFKQLASVIGQGALEQVAIEAEQAAKDVQQFGGEILKTAEKSKSMKAELRGLKAELAAMEEAGNDTGAEFERMVMRAAQLEDQIGDTAARVRALASDTFALDGSIELLNGVAAGYAAVQGVQGLFGEQNEDLQKTLLKVQSAMALVTAAQQLKLLTEKQSTAQLLINQGIEKFGVGIRNAYALATGRLTAAEVAQAAAARGAAASQQILNTVMSVSPVLLLVSAVALLVAVWSKYGDKSKENYEIEKELYGLRAKGFEETISNLDKFYSRLNDIRETQLRLAQIQKSNELELFDIKKLQLDQEERNIQSKRRAVGSETELVSKLDAAYEDYYAKLIDNDGAAAAAAKARIDFLEGQKKLLVELEDAEKKLADQRTILEAERLAKIKEIEKREALASAEAKVLIAADGSKKQLDAQVRVFKEEYRQAIDNTNLTNSEKTKLYLEYLRKVRKAEQDFFKVDNIERKSQSINDIFNITGLDNQGKAAIALTVGFSPEEIKKKLQELNELVLAGTGDFKPVEIPVKPKADMDLFKQVYGAAIEAAKMITDSFYEDEAQKREEDLTNTLSKIDEQKQAELSNKELTEAQRKAIEDKYRRLEAAAKLRAWKADQQAKGEQALINGLLAFTQSLAQQGYPAGLISGGIALGLAGVQAGLIFGKEPPEFAEGTKGNKVTPPGFKLVGEEGPELIFDGGGKKVITAPDTAKILAAYNIPALPDLSGAMALKDAAVGYAMPVIDYDKLGEAVGRNIAKHPKVALSIDKKGLQIHYISGNRKIQILNNDYSG
mgnify:CR=1 FL=1